MTPRQDRGVSNEVSEKTRRFSTPCQEHGVFKSRIKAAGLLDEFRNNREFIQAIAKRTQRRVSNLLAGKEKPLTETEYIQQLIDVRNAIYTAKLSDAARAKIEANLAGIYRKSGPLWSTMTKIKFGILQEIRASGIIPGEKFRHFAKYFLHAFLNSGQAIDPRNQ